MRSPDSSPSSSPARKRQRLSSPTYDEQLGDLSQADIDALEEMEAQTFSSQSPTKNSSQLDVRGPRLQRSSSDDSEYASANTINLADDPDNPFTGEFTNTKNTTAAFPVTSPMPMPGFVSASNLHAGLNARSPSPEEPPNQDFDAWFGPAAAIPAVAFQTASTLSTVGTPITVGFSRASNKGFFQPSHASLAKAQAEMKEIWQDPIPASRNSMSGASTSATTTEDVENALRPPSEAALKSPARRPALHSVGNSFNSPEFNSPVTPSPLGFSRASAVQKNATSGLTPTELFISKNIKPFKSPLPMNRSTTANKDSPGSPLNATNRVGGFASARIQHPLASAPLTADPLPSTASTFSSITTPARRPRASNVGSSLKRGSPAPFVTPFKPGMKPGEPGRLQLEAPSQLKQPATPDNRKTDWLTQERPGDKAGRSGRTGVFDLSQPSRTFASDSRLRPTLASPPNRRTLESSGLKPQQYTADQLESMGINHTELLQMTPKLAMYYSFHTPGDTPLYPLTSSPPVVLGPAQALDTLLDNGCTLATKPWVDNHWGLILWKLAGMVALDPQRESLPNQKRWCWAEVMRQLFYRYERELNCAKRPPLRLITARDAPAACPMVLCVSDVTWKSGSCTDDGTPLEPHPELEVTDGWYRLRAQVDAPLARAVRRGIIRIGRKIAVAGAYLSSERKDAAEVLEAYNSVKLVISGNSSHMAPWHAKLGFTSGPCISTLHSLTQDGGMVAGMDIVVVKAHPIAYLEFIEDESGLRTCQGPMSASEEAAAHEEWKQRWELEMSKLRAEMEKKWNRYEGYLERLERRAGVEEFRPSQDDFPLDVIENIYDELEDPAEAPNVLAGLGRNECGSLAHYIRDRLQKEKAHAAEELEAELKHICPPRNVRSFRIIVVQDSCTRRRPANRKALLTVWDVLNLSFCEGGSPGSFGIGQRFIVTNLKPTQPRSWMDDEPGSEVYLCTTQSSRWTT